MSFLWLIAANKTDSWKVCTKCLPDGCFEVMVEY